MSSSAFSSPSAPMRCDVYDAPITAIVCSGSRGEVYFAAGNTVHCSRTDSLTCSTSVSEPQASSTTVRFATAPPGTTINEIDVAHPSSPRPIVFMGAADRVLAQCGAADDPSRYSCSIVLHADEARVLRIVVDERRGVVHVLTASNDWFYGALDNIAQALRAQTTSSHYDVSARCAFARVSGPRLGVVLAADCLVQHPLLPEGREGDVTGVPEGMAGVSCRLFSATYAGEVVEWEAEEQDECVRVAYTESQQLRGQCARSCYVVSRVQAHPSGCAIFSVRAKATYSMLCGTGSAQDDATVLTRVHLVTCSDDRSVALYERRGSIASTSKHLDRSAEPQERDWVLLWRGSGAGFARSRIFDVALHAASWPYATEGPEQPWRSCIVFVGVAGEDGAVQVVEVNAREDGDLVTWPLRHRTQSDRWRAAATPRLVRLHQHRGHGAYRVAFSTSSPHSVTLISGGFDGAVFAHTLSSALQHETCDMGRAVQLRLHDVMLQPPILATAKDCDGDTIEREELLQLHPSSSSSAKETDQVRSVHVDGRGLLLACTSRALCVLCADTSAHSWWIALPTGALRRRCGVAGDESALDWGVAATLESAVARCCVSSARGPQLSSVGCALVGTTAGVLCAVPYCYTQAELGGSLPVASFAAAHASRPDGDALPFTSALQAFGKITRVSVARMHEGNFGASTHALSGDDDATARHSTDATTSEFVVATNHVYGTIVLSRLLLTLCHACSSGGCSISGDGAVGLCVSAVWHTLIVYSDCPGPLTTALSLMPIRCGRYDAGESNDDGCGCRDGNVAISLWLLVGDRKGCLLGTRYEVMNRALESAANPLDSHALPLATSLKAVAAVHRYVFAEHLHTAISALCAENCSSATSVDGACVSSDTLITVAGTGGVMEYVYLHASTSSSKGEAVGSSPLPSRAREPLRLPFEVSSVLSVSPWLWVVQCGTTVSILHRIPGHSSWVPVGSCDGVRAPRLLTARVVAASPAGSPMAFFAHCSDGRTVERMMVKPGPNALLHPALSPCGAQTTLVHGVGFPGKDYNCVAYAPAPLHCLLMGNEDSSVALYPVLAASSGMGVSNMHSLFGCLLTPLNVCGAHHSNILAMTVLPRTEADALRFVSVGGGAMVNLWSAGLIPSPLQLLDWWCGSGAPSPHNTATSPTDGAPSLDVKSEGASCEPRISSARFQRRREKKVVAASTSLTLTDRIPRFMAVTALSSTDIAVGSSDGTVLFFRVHDDRGAKCGSPQPTGTMLQLRWQGVLNTERPKPVMCLSSTDDGDRDALTRSLNVDRASRFVVAGDTNGVVYAVDAALHVVRAHTRLEQSCVNAISELQRVLTVSPSDADAARHQWRFAALHDSGVVHLMALEVSAAQDGNIQTAELRRLCSASTGLTAGRSAHWPAQSLPLVVVTEEHIIEFDPEAAQRGKLRHLRMQRVSVRCVSGAALVSEASGSKQLPPRSRVAVVGQGFELVG
ncbi:conserved hypothetical protein [Leishmania mexicana MHOM/GT/2001/U1103]|uniref:Uncharacterized protein n=1 Tax=Leishmania mexicana (strain MHOM/GT/2001/U1103) TaxID=929439 RepID=E9ATV5_LEIMU|nr:conserved hypothetical protein [Leishmania mexicana MHOM/GT/2001/U1103]CBZ26380.1 conserved hypothetical protein [Leishmania mexicana MHOM/GT/2001/U1103]